MTNKLRRIFTAACLKSGTSRRGAEAAASTSCCGVHVAPTPAMTTSRPSQLCIRSFARFERCLMATSPAPAMMVEKVVGRSGRDYKIQQTLQDKGIPGGVVYLATNGKDQFILKEIPQDWGVRNKMYRIVASCPHIRLPVDTVCERRMLVFEYLNEHLLNLAQKDLPITQIKRILKYTLEGIAGLHELGIVHNDIKANNILIHTKASPAGIEVEQVLVTDLEDAVQLEPGRVLKGAPLGNLMWRSPEAHAAGPIERFSDIFAFGIVCIYAMTNVVIFAVNNPTLTEDDKLGTIFFRQISCFADESGIQGLLEYLGEGNSTREIFEAVDEACKDVPKEPFAEWDMPSLDDDFKDLVLGMTKLDPRKRITAREGLAHKWFRDV